jgi:hypothetical protein
MRIGSATFDSVVTSRQFSSWRYAGRLLLALPASTWVEMELQEELGYPLFVAPRGVLWFTGGPASILRSLTHLLLCKRGQFDGPPDMSEDEDFETRTDEVHELQEFKQWASLLRSVSPTLVELVLEERPVYLSYLLDHGMGLSPHDETSFYPEFSSFDARFYNHVLKPAFDNGEVWPNLKRLTLRGINLKGFEEEAGEAFQAFTNRTLPGVEVKDVPGNYMLFNTRKGTIMNQDGADGLKSHLDPNADPYQAFFDPYYDLLDGVAF